jgi:hypothetical protein
MRQLHEPQCMCRCHIKGQKDFWFDCCFCSCKGQYINKEGSIDLTAYNDLIRLNYERKPPYIDGGEYVVKNKYNYDSTRVKEKRK